MHRRRKVGTPEQARCLDGRTVENWDGSQISQTKFEHLRIGNRRSVQATDSQQTMLRRVCSLGFDDR
jgi:hypothetical protein